MSMNVAGRRAPNPADMPGDVPQLTSVGLAEGQSIWDRMAAYIRIRNLDMRLLLDGLDKWQRGFYPVTTFRRALGGAFGRQWLELGMTKQEFDEICHPYLTRKPAGPGEPEAYVMWQMFANDIMKYAGDINENEKWFSRTAKTVKQRHQESAAAPTISYAARQQALAESFADQIGFDEDDRPAGGFTASGGYVPGAGHVSVLLIFDQMDMIESAAALAAKTEDKISVMFRTMHEAFQNVDKDRSGMISKEELLDALKLWNVPIDPRAVQALVKKMDEDGNGMISYQEFVDLLARDTVTLGAMHKHDMQADEALKDLGGGPEMYHTTNQTTVTHKKGVVSNGKIGDPFLRRLEEIEKAEAAEQAEEMARPFDMYGGMSNSMVKTQGTIYGNREGRY